MFTIKKIFFIGIILLVLVGVCFMFYIIAHILFATITDFTPAEKQQTLKRFKEPPPLPLDATDTYSFLTWNIGYAGLGKESNFFYDGGKMVTPPKTYVQKNLNGICQVLKTQMNADFILLQEVDICSKRSYRVNQLKTIRKLLIPKYVADFASNYKVSFIPVPFTKPMGKVHSGLASFTQHTPKEAHRYQFPGNFPWPKRIYFLDRCFLVQRYDLTSGKQLVVVNSHNSAFDDGSLKAQQMLFLKTFLTNEYNQGNYIVVGADWNQCPPNLPFDIFAPDAKNKLKQTNISADYLPDWQFVYDKQTPTNRKVATAYQKDKTFTTLIDFYLVSPNIDVLSVETIDLDFNYADHQPVKMSIRLK